MTQDEQLVQRVREALAGIHDVTEKRMFGSLAFMVRGKLCISVRPERIMCRINPDHHNDALKHDGCRTVIMKGRDNRGYVYIDTEYIRKESKLKYWIDMALEYNKSVGK